MADVSSGGAEQVEGQVANDAAASTVRPVLVGGYASTAAPSAVSTDGDAVRGLNDTFGQRAVVHEVDRVRIAGAQLQVKQAEINATASGDTTVVTGVSTKKIRVLSLVFSCSAAVAVAWKSGAGTTKINAMSFAQYGGLSYLHPQGFFVETDASDNLVINLSTTANVRGSLTYCEV